MSQLSRPIILEGQIVWRPGVPSSALSVQTWQEVEEAIANAEGFLKVFVDDPGVVQIPATAATDCLGRAQFENYPGTLDCTVEMLDGGYLRNPLSFSGLTFRGSPTAQPGIVLDIDAAICEFKHGSRLQVGAGGAVPILSMAGNGQTLKFFDNSRPRNTSGGTTRVVDCPTAGNIFFVAFVAKYNVAATNIPPSVPSDTFQGPGTATLIWVSDASVALVAQPAFGGTLISRPIDWAQGVGYDDSLVSPPFGVEEVQAALDVIKAKLIHLGFIGAGPTGSRPVIGTYPIGWYYFDTTLGYPIWDNGTLWVDAAGAGV